MTLSYLLLRRLGAIGIAGVFFGFAGLTDVYAAAAAAGKSAAAARGGPGAEVCKGCHESYVDSYSKSIHGQKGHRNSPANAGGCASCHGDASKHVNAGGGKGGVKGFSGKGNAQAKSESCLNCHEGNRKLAFWDSGKHKRGDVSCNNCHSIHGAPKDPSISPYVTTVRKLEYETCNNCHRDVRTQILKPAHHPIVEGKVKCSDCHNPHGALSKAMVKNESVNDLCVTCHAEKRGPYIAEHPPVAENCLNCHVPHGSNHSRLLNQRMPLLCQDCHTGASHLGTIWNQKDAFVPLGSTRLVTSVTSTTAGSTTAAGSRFITRSCVNCHNTIHGSMAPQSPGQRFRR